MITDHNQQPTKEQSKQEGCPKRKKWKKQNERVIDLMCELNSSIQNHLEAT